MIVARHELYVADNGQFSLYSGAVCGVKAIELGLMCRSLAGCRPLIIREPGDQDDEADLPQANQLHRRH